jgi:DNA-binding phage protein
MRSVSKLVQQAIDGGMSKKRLAAKAGVTVKQLDYLLRGSLLTSLRTVAAVSLALGFVATIEFQPRTVLDKMIEDPTDDPEEELKRTVRL